MPRRLPSASAEEIDHNGNVRIYFRPTHGRKIRLRAMPWTPAFMEEYERAKDGHPTPTNAAPHPGAWRWLCLRYFAECFYFKRLDKRTERVRQLILESKFNDPIAPKSAKFFCDFPISKMPLKAIRQVLNSL